MVYRFFATAVGKGRDCAAGRERGEKAATSGQTKAHIVGIGNKLFQKAVWKGEPKPRKTCKPEKHLIPRQERGDLMLGRAEKERLSTEEPTQRFC